MQTALGGHEVFEHPTGARTWSYEEMQALCKKHITVNVHMCRYGLKLLQSERFIRKSTRLLVSSEDMKQLAKLCPGKDDPQHVCHDVVCGSAPGVPSVSAFAGAYSPEFVHAVLGCVPAFQDPVVALVEDFVSPAQWNEVCAVGKPSEAELQKVLHRLHKNLGHPPNADLVRIFKHGQVTRKRSPTSRIAAAV